MHHTEVTRRIISPQTGMPNLDCQSRTLMVKFLIHMDLPTGISWNVWLNVQIRKFWAYYREICEMAEDACYAFSASWTRVTGSLQWYKIFHIFPADDDEDSIQSSPLKKTRIMLHVLPQSSSVSLLSILSIDEYSQLFLQVAILFTGFSSKYHAQPSKWILTTSK